MASSPRYGLELSPAAICLARAGWQPTLFARQLQRADLLALQASWPCRPLRIQVHRNQTFELVAGPLLRYLAFAGLKAEFQYSDYDDALSDRPEPADLQIVWLDYSRYRRLDADWRAWLEARVRSLREAGSGPVLVANLDLDGPDAMACNQAMAAWRIPDVLVCDRTPTLQALGADYWDERAAVFSGTRLSDQACLQFARQLGGRWIPHALSPRIKAVVVDLDHTLYSGVLGEDGAEQVALTPGHRRLQERLAALGGAGMLLAALSRNELEDVRALFAARPDFPLRWDHFSVAHVSWADKADGIESIAAQLRIAPDSMLVVDDNPGELCHLAQHFPGMALLHANAADADETERALAHYPGVWTPKASHEDQLRSRDLAANQARAAIASERSQEEYLRELQARIKLGCNQRQHLARLRDLSQKTNQFNLSLQRLSEQQLDHLLDNGDAAVVSIELSDRLSDSGLIGLVAAQLRGSKLEVRELCLSCRALGRQLETVMVEEAVRMLRRRLGGTEVEFAYVRGPRNQPALSWLSAAAGAELCGDSGIMPMPTQFAAGTPPQYPVDIERSFDDGASN